MSEDKNLEYDEMIYLKILKKIVKYVQDNAAGITLLSTSTIAVGSVLIRYVSYLIECGKTLYFNIPRSLIDVSGDNILYDFFVKGIIAVCFLLLNLIPYFLWKSQKNIWVKLSVSFLIVFSPNLLVIIGIVLDTFRGISYSLKNICLLLVSGLIIGIVFFFNGFFYAISENRLSRKRKKKNKHRNFTFSEKLSQTIIAIAVLFVLESSLFILFGSLTAASQNEFKIINNDNGTYYAVIYENSEKYIITECKIDNNNIIFNNLDTKQEIDRTEVEYNLQRLTPKKENIQ